MGVIIGACWTETLARGAFVSGREFVSKHHHFKRNVSHPSYCFLHQTHPNYFPPNFQLAKENEFGPSLGRIGEHSRWVHFLELLALSSWENLDFVRWRSWSIWSIPTFWLMIFAPNLAQLHLFSEALHWTLACWLKAWWAESRMNHGAAAGKILVWCSALGFRRPDLAKISSEGYRNLWDDQHCFRSGAHLKFKKHFMFLIELRLVDD